MSDAAPTPADQRPRPVAVPGDANRRRWGLALIGFVLMGGTAFGFWYVLQSVDQRSQYVVAARDIARWDTVSSADFRLVEAHIGDGSAAVASEMGAIYGQWAAGPIPAGTFITPGMFRRPPLSSDAEATSVVIQVSLPAEEVSYGALETGDTIALLGREPSGDPALGLGSDTGADTGLAAQEPPLALIGVLQLDSVQGGNAIYVVEPTEALAIQSLVKRYLAATDRQIWRLGFDLTADDIQRALDSSAGLVNNGLE